MYSPQRTQLSFYKMLRLSKIILPAISIFLLLCSINISPAQNITFSDIKEIVNRREYPKAVDLLKKFIYHSPDSIQAYILLSKVHLAIGGYNHESAAESVIRKGLLRHPKNLELLITYSRLTGKTFLKDIFSDWIDEVIHEKKFKFKELDIFLNSYSLEIDSTKLFSLHTILKNTLKSDSSNFLNYLSLGKLKLLLGNYSKAVPVLEQGLLIRPENIALLRQLYQAYLYNGEYKSFSDTYFKWLKNETNSELLEYEYKAAGLIMAKNEADGLLKLPLEDKYLYLRKFWRENDPYPNTYVNERLITYMKRLLYTRKHFTVEISEYGFDERAKTFIKSEYGFDDRGKTYIKYGEPEKKYRDINPGAIKLSYNLTSEKTLDDIKIGEVKPASNVSNELIIIKNRKNESWYYPSRDYHMTFDFVCDEKGYYHEVMQLSLSALAGGDDVRTGLNESDLARFSSWFTQILYKNRSNLGGIYAVLAITENFAKEHENYMKLKKKFREHLLPFYEIEPIYPKLNCAYRLSQVRDDNNVTQIEYAFGIPMNQFSLSGIVDSTVHLEFETELLAHNQTTKDIIKYNNYECLCPPGLDYSQVHYTNIEKLNLSPGNYTLNIRLFEKTKSMEYKISDSITVRDFTQNILSISDLKFSQRITKEGIDEETGKEKLSVMPYPFHSIKRSQPVYLYFEIYNLKNADDNSYNYKWSYSLTHVSGKNEKIKNINPLSGKEIIKSSNCEDVQEYCELNFSQTDVGKYYLTVNVEDLSSFEEGEIKIEFELVE